MYLEGMIDKRDVLEPDRKRDYADGPWLHYEWWR
jgi:hypothetical protein